MKVLDLRPLTLGELLDRTFSLYRNNFWLFVGIMAMPAVISVPFSAWFFSMRGAAAFTGKPSPTFAAGGAVVALAFMLLLWMVYAVAIGATTYAVSGAYLGQNSTVRESYGKVRGKMWRILGVVVVTLLRSLGMLVLIGIGMAIVIGVLVGTRAFIARAGGGQPRPILGGIIAVVVILTYLAGLGLWILWSLRYAVSIPTLLLENLGVLASIRRSIKLTRGRRWQMLVAVVLYTIIAYAGVIVFQGPFFLTMFWSRGNSIPEWLALIFAVSGAVGGAITGPLLMILLVVCYYDTRIRKEAFDLQFMMSSLDNPAPAPGIAPAG
jgi:hypothetical protein